MNETFHPILFNATSFFSENLIDSSPMGGISDSNEFSFYPKINSLSTEKYNLYAHE